MSNLGNNSQESSANSGKPLNQFNSSPFFPNSKPNISVDDLVKKIDKKLAEMEEEEQKKPMIKIFQKIMIYQMLLVKINLKQIL